MMYTTHHVLKHMYALQPERFKILLWLIAEDPGFNIVLGCSMFHPYLGLLVGLTYPLSFLQAIVVFSLCLPEQDQKWSNYSEQTYFR